MGIHWSVTVTMVAIKILKYLAIFSMAILVVECCNAKLEELEERSDERSDEMSDETPVQLKCPKCNSLDIVEIVYGRPGSELMAKAEAGEVFLGGCDMSKEETHHCNQCQFNFKPTEVP